MRELLAPACGERAARVVGPRGCVAVEGTGVIIRGLNFVRSELNGRDIFSANGGTVLNFNEVSPELLGRVEVFKNNTADMIDWLITLVLILIKLGFIFAVIMTTTVALVHLPLRTANGGLLEMPLVFVFGFWVAIVTGIIFISIYTRRVTTEMTSMSEALLATQMALAREQKLTDLGGVVAATAHELGTPLATIKLVSAELMEELKDIEPLHADAQLIREQAERCGAILRSMGRAGKEDLHLRTTLWSALVREAAEPHLDRGKTVTFAFEDNLETDPDQPQTFRKPEVIHGLRNLIQNAVDFSKSQVRVDIRWSKDSLAVKISDDGRGYAPQVINRIGDPFVRRRNRSSTHGARPGYDGMGLGLFIAKTLLERSGADLEFFNGTKSDPLRGAIVTSTWPRRTRAPSSNAIRSMIPGISGRISTESSVK